MSFFTEIKSSIFKKRRDTDNFFNVYFCERKRWGEGQRERETEDLKWVLH